MAATRYVFRLWLYTSIIFVAIVLYLTFVALPFFGYGLHLQPSYLVVSGSFDPKGYPLYLDGYVGGILRWITIILPVLGPTLIVLFGGLLMVTLPRGWPYFTLSQKIVGLSILLASLTFFVLAFSPTGLLIMRWQWD
jgi:hypothetical protein